VTDDATLTISGFAGEGLVALDVETLARTWQSGDIL